MGIATAPLRQLEKNLGRYEYLNELEDKLGIRSITLLIIALPLLILGIIYDVSPNVYCNAVGYLYPTIASIRAIETLDKSDDLQWLVYWVVFACMNNLEGFFLNQILQVFPFYWAFKFGFLIWCQAPTSRGAIYLYSHIFSPFIKSHQITQVEIKR